MTERVPHPVALSDLLRRRLRDGTRISDLLVRAEGPAWEVRAIVADGAFHEAHWHDGELAIGGIVGTAGLVSLKDDLLDHQVVDARGRRVVRIGDVALASVDGRLEAVALEIGLRPVVRRLGLRRIARHLEEDLIHLDAVDVTESCVIAHASREHIADIETHHLARLVRRLPHRMKHDVLDRLPEDRRREVHEHIANRPHRPRWNRYRTPRA